MSSRYASAAKRALRTIQKGEKEEDERRTLVALNAKAAVYGLTEDEESKRKQLAKIYQDEEGRYYGGAKKTSLDKLTVKELQKKCSNKGIKYSGLKKDELIKALRK